MLAVCGGYQLLGHSYQLGAEELPGIGLVDLRTVREDGPAADRQLRHPRPTWAPGPAPSPGSRTTAGAPTSATPALALGRVLEGHGNNGRDGLEGVQPGNVIGTYLHGPLLPKNVWLADRLIEMALGVSLEPLDDRLEDAAHASAKRAAGV